MTLEQEKQWQEEFEEIKKISGNANIPTNEEAMALGFYFEGRKKAQEEIEKQSKIIELLKQSNEFYANPDNWTRRDSIFWENIDRRDCANYPHITRDMRPTGGKIARKIKKEVEEIEEEEGVC